MVEGAGDSVSENLNEGWDTVESSISYTLGANLENLTLTGTAAINGTGNTLNNSLIGNSAGNILTGGAGNDSLDGGAGADTTITQVSSDAIQDEKLGLIYSTRVKLKKDTIKVENKTVRLTPGMAVTVEVKTGTRRVIEYFMSPLMQVSSESLRER